MTSTILHQRYKKRLQVNKSICLLQQHNELYSMRNNVTEKWLGRVMEGGIGNERTAVQKWNDT